MSSLFKVNLQGLKRHKQVSKYLKQFVVITYMEGSTR